ncbi:MAG: ComF family protein [Bacteroidetes bacterium]|nr:ComF family protein [Bacteroidota bacterium]
MQSLKEIFSSTLHLFYPHTCTGCGSDIIENDNQLCLHCINELPHTNFESHANNPIEKIFWGRMPLVAAHSEFYFSKGGLIQELIHALKYKNNTAIGFYLGEIMGNRLLASGRFSNVEALVPLPLFPDKEHKRGYNQAAVICNGIASAMNIPVITGNITRRRFTETQTRKHRTERWENVEGSFMVRNPEALAGKHALLIDDVITTGATLEACGSIMQKIPGVHLYIASLAYAAK